MFRLIASTSGRIGKQTVVASTVRSNSTVAVPQVAQNDLDTAKPYEAIPGPKPLPIIGNIWRFLPYIGKQFKINVINTMFPVMFIQHL